MNANAQSIVNLLKTDPGMYHITPNGENMYFLADGELVHVTHLDKNFNEMTDAELTAFIDILDI